MPEAPVLILLGPPGVARGLHGVAHGPHDAPVILGLGLVERAILAARRAGYGQVFLLKRDATGSNQDRHCERSEAIQGSVGSRTPPGLLRRFAPRNDSSVRGPLALGGGDSKTSGPAVANWRRLAATLSSHTAPLVVAPAAILAETNWLERAASARIAPGAWAAIPNRIVMISAAAARAAADALSEDGGAEDLAAVEDRLARAFGPPAPVPSGIDPMAVESSEDVRAAERRLLRGLTKDTDGFMARHVERPISLEISRRLAPTAITPNQMSLISIAVGICGGPFFLSSHPLMQTIGALLFLAHSILDGCDGELARLKFQQSRLGGVLDFWGDNVVHSVIFGSMAVGWSLSAGATWPLGLGAAAILGTLASAGFVYWRLMRVKDDGAFASVSASPERPLARLLDSASRRDFIYLVVLLALVGRSHWFLILAAIGAPVYFALVLLAARPRGPTGEAGQRAGGAPRAAPIDERSLGPGRVGP